MDISYNFNGDEYVYNTPIYDFVESSRSFEDILDMYIENIYRKNPKEVEELKNDLGINSEEELRDYVYSVDDDSWMIDELIDVLGEDYFYDWELKDFYEDDAYESYLSDISIEDIENEDNERIMHLHWINSR